MVTPERPRREQRAARRHRSRDQHGILTALVRPGHEVSVVNASAYGALVESRCRLLPNAYIEVQLTTREGQSAVRARVARCSVARLQAAAVWYRAGIAFMCPLPWVGDGAGYGVPSPERAGSTRGEGATRYGR
jgi:hypothetical protein